MGVKNGHAVRIPVICSFTIGTFITLNIKGELCCFYINGSPAKQLGNLNELNDCFAELDNSMNERDCCFSCYHIVVQYEIK